MKKYKELTILIAEDDDAQELLGSLFPERTVRSELIVLLAPSFDLGPCIFHRQEPVHVQAFISKASVE